MKILYIITKPNHGGAQEYVLSLACRAVEQGNAVVMATGSDGWLTQKARCAGVVVELIPSLLHLPFSLFTLARECRLLVQGVSYDIIHLNSSAALFAALPLRLLTSSKILFTFHGLSLLSDGWNGLKTSKLFYLWQMRFFGQFLDGALFVSQADHRKSKKLRLLANTVQQTVVYNGIPPINFVEKKIVRAALGELIQKNIENSYIVGTIARLAYQKNIPLFLEIASRDEKNTIYIILGSGPEKESTLRCIQEKSLTDRVFLIGSLDEPRKYLKAFDVFLMTSRYEGLPFSLLEALQAGIPLVASSVGGVSEILPETSQCVVNNNSVDEYVRMLENVREEKNRQDFGREFREHVNNQFTAEKMCADTFSFYRAV